MQVDSVSGMLESRPVLHNHGLRGAPPQRDVPTRGRWQTATAPYKLLTLPKKYARRLTPEPASRQKTSFSPPITRTPGGTHSTPTQICGSKKR